MRRIVALTGIALLAASGMVGVPVPDGVAQDVAPQDVAAFRFSDDERKLLDVCDAIGWTAGAKGKPVAIRALPWEHEDALIGPPDMRAVERWGWVTGERESVVTYLDGGGVVRTVRRAARLERDGDAVIREIPAHGALGRVLRDEACGAQSMIDGALGVGDRTARVIAAAQFRRAGRADLARRALDSLGSLDSKDDAPPLVIARGEVAELVLWRTVRAFEDTSVPRAELRRRLRIWDAEFRGTEHEAMAADLLREMERMVPEDEVRAARGAGVSPAAERTVAPSEDPAARDRAEPRAGQTAAGVAEDLVWLLRDCGLGIEIPLGTHEWRRLDEEIRALGWEAVPALLDALENTRTTRAVIAWRDFYFPGHRVLRVGDLAKDIVETIAYRRFGAADRHTACGEPGWDRVVADARAWWATAGREREIFALRHEMREASCPTASPAFRRFAVLVPAEAIELALRDVDAAADDAGRVRAVEQLARIPGAGTITALRGLTAPGADPSARIRAALALRELGDPSVVPLLRELWDLVAKFPVAGAEVVRPLAAALTEFDDDARRKLVIAAREDPQRIGPLISGVWREAFRRRTAPAVRGVAREFLADLALDVLRRPALTPPADDAPRGLASWDRRDAVAALAHARGTPLDRDAPPIDRLLAERSLVAAECAERDLAPPPLPTLLDSADVSREPPPVPGESGGSSPGTVPEAPPGATPDERGVDDGADSDAAADPPASAPRIVESLSLAAGNPLKPGDASLAPLRALVGRRLDAAAFDSALRGAFRVRPEGCTTVALRVWRSDGPWHAEAWFGPGRAGSQLTIELGSGDGIARSDSFARIGGPPIDDVPAGRIDERFVAAALRDGESRGGILDVRLATR